VFLLFVGSIELTIFDNNAVVIVRPFKKYSTESTGDLFVCFIKGV
jgi:hypothetical protein